MSLDASMLAAKRVRDYEAYVTETEPGYIDYYATDHLSFEDWEARENPEDPDTDA